MGNNDEGKSSKSDKSSSLAPTDQTNIHVYPDWAAMQAYYGPRVTMPPYYNSAVASGHAPPPYMWGPPQPMIPPYGAPYAAIYSHGGVYAHPAVPLTIIMQATAPVETPTKSSGNTERGLVKKLKLAMSIVNGTAENAEGGPEPRLSQSVGTEGSTDGSDSNTTGTDQSRWKRSREGTPTIGGDGKNEAKSNAVVVGEVTATVSPKPLGTVLSPGMTTALELRNPSTINAKSSPTSLPCGVMPSEVWLQNDRELKRERRKQSNRESARRSRLRKQAETEELARKVESLTAENAALRSEINQLSEKSEKLRLENATLVEGLKSGKLGHAQEIIMNKKEDQEGEMYEKKSNSGAKLHQLLDASPRAADAVAAG
ncbi:common plant regulatory factor 1-like isoform X2 [Durio zibethinus]|uniref:Common plant regulatory factor 1-like isoform X2 n=1 Tax=Durio zibethinus TaxID=66656 RepID=A0A6P5ZY82_DURZI|nr:common plant regulatory factor 1-like isoform X2 [Durio zibethinus]